MIRRLEIDVRRPGSTGEPVELTVLAVSDEPEPGLEEVAVREQIGRPDLIVGCGDLDAPYLAMLADAFVAPLLFVRGNHDRGDTWDARAKDLPEPLPDGRPVRFGPISIVGLSWPGTTRGRAIHDDGAAWGQVLRLAFRLLRRRRPLVVLSHMPPQGLGDVASDRFHRGFRAYRWLVDRLHPALWLHGHVHPAARNDPLVLTDPLPIVNVTGAVVIRITA
jgi:hypothetical protein